MATYTVFTISSGNVSQGAVVTKLALKGAGVEIPVITVGEIGRGRHQEALAVVHLPQDLYAKWQEKGLVRVFAGKIGKTQSGKWKLFVEAEADTDEKIIAVMPTKIGFRGGNSHTSDRTGETRKDLSGRECPVFAEFPGTILVQGSIAQGDAGNMGCGSQIIAVVPKDVWFRTGYSGRLYGGPSAHYYRWDGKTLTAMTWDERQLVKTSQEANEEEAIEWL